MQGYYSKKLSAERLRLCYDIAPPRVQRYLEAEIDFVLEKTKPARRILELGCGYGRVLQRLLHPAKTVTGIDTSCESLQLAGKLLGKFSCYLLEMDAAELAFGSGQFDAVICIQNGISAFKVDPKKLIDEAVRVTGSGGTVLFSSYAERFWEDRLEWFRIQADYGLIGEIDWQATGNGVIVCKDGFRAATLGPAAFRDLTAHLNLAVNISEVDDSSVFCEIVVD